MRFQGGSLVPHRIPGASHFKELHAQRESFEAIGEAPTRFGCIICGQLLEKSLGLVASQQIPAEPHHVIEGCLALGEGGIVFSEVTEEILGRGELQSRG
ncbi:hypothetical protein O181_040652 [Austropuccinia psidii MF-1]|uniref:Uncharacterized protein n=1 Tax=Austropuccinia psidii MF-1 TaxID=1389203 RepID=A0A9Q3HE38_9BASI|nr:hypothetical protein [Austropuccinia psidii MF-1]